MSWADQAHVRRAIVSPGGAEPALETVALEWDPQEEFIHSDVQAGASQLLLIAERPLGSRGRLIELDAAGAVLASTVTASYGILVGHDGEALFVDTATNGTHLAIRVGRVRRALDQLAIVDRVDVAEVEIAPAFQAAWISLSAAPQGDGILVFVDLIDRTLLLRVSSALEVERKIEIEERLFDPTITEADGRLFIAGSRRTDELYDYELFITELDQVTLDRLTDWVRVSAPDQLGSAGTSLVRTDGGLLAIWGEGLGNIRARCIPWE